MTKTICNICEVEYPTKKACLEHCVDDHIMSNKVEHNQCDFCFKKFRTALGFHRHYPNCPKRTGMRV